jgi:hypothetical protein
MNSTVAIRQGSHICISARNVLGRTVVDDSTIVFRMNDGSYYKNTLEDPCPGLRIADAFNFVSRDEYICGRQQRISVRGRDTVCWLGEFERTTSPLKVGDK